MQYWPKVVGIQNETGTVVPLHIVACIMAADIPHNVSNAMVACGISNVAAFQGHTQAERIAADIFDDIFATGMDITFKELDEHFRRFLSWAYGSSGTDLYPAGTSFALGVPELFLITTSCIQIGTLRCCYVVVEVCTEPVSATQCPWLNRRGKAIAQWLEATPWNQKRKEQLPSALFHSIKISQSVLLNVWHRLWLFMNKVAKRMTHAVYIKSGFATLWWSKPTWEIRTPLLQLLFGAWFATTKMPGLFYVLRRCSWLGGLNPHSTKLPSSG